MLRILGCFWFSGRFSLQPNAPPSYNSVLGGLFLCLRLWDSEFRKALRCFGFLEVILVFLQRSENADVHNSFEATQRRVVETDGGGKRLEHAWDQAAVDQSSHMSGNLERMCWLECLWIEVWSLGIFRSRTWRWKRQERIGTVIRVPLQCSIRAGVTQSRTRLRRRRGSDGRTVGRGVRARRRHVGGRRWRRDWRGFRAAKARRHRRVAGESNRSYSLRRMSRKSGWLRSSPACSSPSSPFPVEGTISSAFGSGTSVLRFHFNGLDWFYSLYLFPTYFR